MPGKLATKLPIYFEEVWRLYAANDGKRMVQTDPDSRFSITTVKAGTNHSMMKRRLPSPWLELGLSWGKSTEAVGGFYFNALQAFTSLYSGLSF